MSKGHYVNVPLYKIFDFSIGTNSGLTKSFVNENKGTIPVYGASKNTTEPSYGYIRDNIPNVKYFDNCLTYNKDGASGYLFYRKGRFSVSEKVVPLILYPELLSTLDYEYLKFAIEEISTRNDYTYSNKATKTKFKDIIIPIPVLEDGSYNVELQKELSIKYKQVENQKEILLLKAKRLKDTIVVLPQVNNISWTYLKISDLFTPTNGDSKYTKKWCRNNSGDFPVYSGNTSMIYAKINENIYDGEYLTWAKDGLAGYIMYHNEKFSITGHRGILVPTKKCENIDLKYIKFVIEPIFRKNIKGRIGELGKNEYTTLNPDMIYKIPDVIPIPVRPDGIFDLEKQKEIAFKYEQIETIKEQILRKIDKLLDVKVKS